MDARSLVLRSRSNVPTGGRSGLELRATPADSQQGNRDLELSRKERNSASTLSEPGRGSSPSLQMQTAARLRPREVPEWRSQPRRVWTPDP